jgi:hypothetical protein
MLTIYFITNIYDLKMLFKANYFVRKVVGMIFFTNENKNETLIKDLEK